MKPLPKDPFAFQTRVMAALCDDIADRNSPSFRRLDAIREINREARAVQKTAGGNS